MPEIVTCTFSENNLNWSKREDLNQIFLTATMNYANHKLQANGFIFLNEIFEQLGLDRTGYGQVHGWTREVSDHIPYEMIVRDDKIILTFNVQGVIVKSIDEIVKKARVRQ